MLQEIMKSRKDDLFCVFVGVSVLKYLTIILVRCSGFVI